MCRLLHRSFACTHTEELRIQCASHSILTSLTAPECICSLNVPVLIEARAEATQFLLNNCIEQSQLPEMRRVSRELCLECASTTYFRRRVARGSGYGSEQLDGEGGGKPRLKLPLFKKFAWRDEEGRVRYDARGPKPPEKDERHSSEALEKAKTATPSTSLREFRIPAKQDWTKGRSAN